MKKLLKLAAVVAVAAAASACVIIDVERGPEDPAKAKPAPAAGQSL